jgi:hypothetical protein
MEDYWRASKRNKLDKAYSKPHIELIQSPKDEDEMVYSTIIPHIE